MAGGSKKSDSKKYHSTMKKSLIMTAKPGWTRVLDVCAPPFLHCFLGIVNKTYDELVKMIPEVAQWPSELNLSREDYHGTVFEGNECKKLLENLPALEKVLNKCNRLEDGRPFLQVLQTFSRITSFIHKPQIDVEKVSTAIMRFKIAWQETSMTLTTKAHIIIDHLIDFIQAQNRQNMSFFSEQSHEAVHAEFMKTWTKYIVKEVSNPRFKSQLLKATLDYNACHAT